MELFDDGPSFDSSQAQAFAGINNSQIAGATAAITVLLFFNKSKIGINCILSRMRPLIQESIQIPQSIQIVLSIKVVLLLLSNFIASKGHDLWQPYLLFLSGLQFSPEHSSFSTIFLLTL